MRAVVTSAVIALGLASSIGGAEAATNQARNRCGDAVRILRTNPTMLELGEEIDPLAVELASRHWNQVIDGWNRASKQIDLIPKQDLDEQDPDLAECFTEVRKWAAYIKTLDARIKVAQEQAKVVRPFLETMRAYRTSLWPLVLTHYGATDMFQNGTPEDARRSIEDLAKVEAACTQQLPAAGAAMPVLASAGAQNVRNHGGVSVPAAFENKADVWCFVAKHRAALMSKALAAKSFRAPGFGNYGILFPEAIKDFAAGRTALDVWVAIVIADPAPFQRALRNEVKAWYTAVGMEAPADPFPQIDAALTAMRQGAETASAQVRFEDKGQHSSALEGLGRDSVKKAEPSSKILASTMDAADFTISKNAAGIPTDRFRSGRVLIKRPKASWCEERTFSYVETYQGGGRFQRSSTASLTEATRLVRCP